MESKLSKRTLLGELIDLGVNPKNIAEVEQRLKKVEKKPDISVGGGGFSPVQTVNGQKPDNYGNIKLSESLAIGSPVVGGIANSLLYVNSLGNVAQDVYFDGTNLSVEGTLASLRRVDLSAVTGRNDLMYAGDGVNLDWALYWDGDNQVTALTTGFRVDGFLESVGGLSTPSIYGLGITTNQVAYVSFGQLVGDANFTYNPTTDQLALGATGSGAGILIGGDAQLFRGAANRLDLASGDSFYVINDVGAFSVGTPPNTNFTANVRRTTTGTLSTSPAVINSEFHINHGVTGFPSALRMFVPINAGLNNVGYAAGISAQVSVQNGQAAQANNITAADFSARWNTNQATATSNSLLGARIYTTSNNATISGSVGNLFGVSLEAGVATGATTFTVTSSIVAAEYIIRVPQAGAATASAFGSSYGNHIIGTSAPINIAGHIRLAPLTAAYGSGAKYPVLFNGTSTNPNEIGIWWGTDANRVNVYRGGNDQLRTDDQFRAASLTTDGTNSWQLGGLTTVATVFDTTRHLNVTVGGTAYKVALVV